MIFEALSAIEDKIGSDISAIVHFIEVRWSCLICHPLVHWAIYCPEVICIRLYKFSWLQKHSVCNWDEKKSVSANSGTVLERHGMHLYKAFQHDMNFKSNRFACII